MTSVRSLGGRVAVLERAQQAASAAWAGTLPAAASRRRRSRRKA